jgi:hypothetical protein
MMTLKCTLQLITWKPGCWLDSQRKNYDIHFSATNSDGNVQFVRDGNVQFEDLHRISAIKFRGPKYVFNHLKGLLF